MNNDRKLIVIDNKDKTDSVESLQLRGNKCDVIYKNSSKVYSYNRCNVKILDLKKKVDSEKIVFRYKGEAVNNIRDIFDFGEFYKVVQVDGQELLCEAKAVQIAVNCLAEERSKELFQYFKETATAVSLKLEDDVNLLKLQYDKVEKIDECTVLSRYLKPSLQIEKREYAKPLIFPFGLNQSQKQAVENAFSSQISIIQGPPGTGKTQTILNIIANAVKQGKSVAVVSNNNPAIENVVEKMQKQGVSFLAALLGSLKNKQNFLVAQSDRYPNMQEWVLDQESKIMLDAEILNLSEELNNMLEIRNRIAEIERELLELKPEHFDFERYYEDKQTLEINADVLYKLSTRKLLTLWVEYEFNSRTKIGLLRRLLLYLRFTKKGLALFSQAPEEVLPFIQNLYYRNKITELKEEKEILEARLSDYCFDDKMKELSEKSMSLFKGELADKFAWQQPRIAFTKGDFRDNSVRFNREYPVILSTTYSIKGTLSTDYIYDYLIVDEASQVDLATSVLAFSCAKNIVIVGDQKQLTHVLPDDDKRIADDIWNKYDFDEVYQFSKHNLLSSATIIWKDVPTVLLREHYRCHPKIANFFNQKFYDGHLIIMTEDQGEKDVLAMYRTAPGNHARGYMNQRQIDVVKQEILPKLNDKGCNDIGFITPYREQVKAIQAQLGTAYEVDTVHKFQGREKEDIVLTSVDNVISEFVDDPKILNVAVSRAVKSLTVVISDSKENEKTNYGDLAKYIKYNNMQIVESKIFSIFDLLYKEYYQQRVQYLKNHKRVSEYDSENLAYAVIQNILRKLKFSNIDCATHVSLNTFIRDYSLLTEEEIKYVSNPLTHSDFLLFNKMDKVPILAIEIDGTQYHAEGSRQVKRDALKDNIMKKHELPLLRIRTDESGIEERIIKKINEVMDKTYRSF